MKVAFFLGSLKRGGAESLIYDICRKREVAPFDMCCLYRKDDDYSEAFKATGAELIQVKRSGSIFKYLQDLRHVIIEHHIDIVHAQTASNALISFLSLLFTRIRLVTSFHGFSFSDAPWWYRRIVYGGSKRIICVSEFEKCHYQHKWRLPDNNKIRVVYNGIDFSKFDISRPDLPDPFIVCGETLNMVMVGSFIEGRSQFFVCQVMRRLEQEGIPFNMYFAGRRDEAEPWRYDDCVAFCEKNGLTEKVHFLGNRSDIPDLLRQMDLFLYASEHDTFGIAVIEALASGLPVLVNDWEVMKEITSNGDLATLYKTQDWDDCVAKIKQVVGNKTHSISQAHKSAHVVRDRFSIENHIKKLSQVYEEALL